jgi:general secretion pathway protein G
MTYVQRARKRRSMAHATIPGKNGTGFTLIELLLVLLLVAMLASLVTPVVTSSIGRAKESTLKENLYVLRKAIDDYYADTGKYPESLDDLFNKRYVRKIPRDPMTESKDTWVLVHADDNDGRGQAGIIDIHSGSEATGSDGLAYRDW